MSDLENKTASNNETLGTASSAETIQQATELIGGLCIIPQSLGLWETYFTRLAGAWGTIHEEIRPTHIIYSADNGVTEEGYISFGSEITRMQTANMVNGGSAVTCFARFAHIPVEVVDVGINSEAPIGRNCKARQGTRNFLTEEAMTVGEYTHVCLEAELLIESLKAQGINLISFGEMGIGNTTTSAAVLSALTGLDPRMTVGPGSGADKTMLKKKRDIVQRALAIHKDQLIDAESCIRCVGGFDIAALTASMLACVRLRMPFVIDGFITAVALACACRINKEAEHFAIPSHKSREFGMDVALRFCNINLNEVPIDASMALGEGTGAVMMVQLLQTAHFAFLHMSTLKEIMTETP